MAAALALATASISRAKSLAIAGASLVLATKIYRPDTLITAAYWPAMVASGCVPISWNSAAKLTPIAWTGQHGKLIMMAVFFLPATWNYGRHGLKIRA